MLRQMNLAQFLEEVIKDKVQDKDQEAELVIMEVIEQWVQENFQILAWR